MEPSVFIHCCHRELRDAAILEMQGTLVIPSSLLCGREKGDTVPLGTLSESGNACSLKIGTAVIEGILHPFTRPVAILQKRSSCASSLVRKRSRDDIAPSNTVSSKACFPSGNRQLFSTWWNDIGQSCDWLRELERTAEPLPPTVYDVIAITNHRCVLNSKPVRVFMQPT